MSKLIKQKPSGYEVLKSFQLGGAININEEKKKELFPYFAYIYSKELNPEKYGSAKSIEEWRSLMSESDADIIAKAAAQLSNDEWAKLEDNYKTAQGDNIQATMQEEQIVQGAKGAKLNKLKEITKKQKGGVNYVPSKSALTHIASNNVTSAGKKEDGGPIVEAKNGMKTKSKRKKCSCGCDLLLSRSAGGKVIETCACKCGGKMKKKPMKKK